jgi:hypothetical protein
VCAPVSYLFRFADSATPFSFCQPVSKPSRGHRDQRPLSALELDVDLDFGVCSFLPKITLVRSKERRQFRNMLENIMKVQGLLIEELGISSSFH